MAAHALCLMDLPQEIHLYILDHLRPRELFMLAYTSRTWRLLIVHQMPNKPQFYPLPSLWLMDRLMRKAFSTTLAPSAAGCERNVFAQIATELSSTGCLCVLAFLISDRCKCFVTTKESPGRFGRWRETESQTVQRLRLLESLRTVGVREAVRHGHLALLKWMIRNVKYIDPVPLIQDAADAKQWHVWRFLGQFDIEGDVDLSDTWLHAMVSADE
jgi:hypothetical protein